MVTLAGGYAIDRHVRSNTTYDSDTNTSHQTIEGRNMFCPVRSLVKLRRLSNRVLTVEERIKHRTLNVKIEFVKIVHIKEKLGRKTLQFLIYESRGYTGFYVRPRRKRTQGTDRDDCVEASEKQKNQPFEQ